MKFFKKLIQKHIEKLKGEREAILRMLDVCEKDSFRYNIINHSGGFLNFRIAIWEALL